MKRGTKTDIKQKIDPRVIRIVIHHTCKSSYVLYKALKDTAGVKFEMAQVPYFKYLGQYVLSVPAVFNNEELVLLDPVEPDDVVKLLKGDVARELGVEEALENLARGIMASQALLTLVALYKSLKPLRDPALVSILSRARYHKQEGLVPAILDAMEKKEGEILTANWEYFIKLLTYGIVREMYWLKVDIDEVERSHIKMWLLAKASVGRLGLPYPNPTVPEDVIEAIYATLKESGRRYMDKIKEEQEMILSDKEFLSIRQE